VRLTGFISEGFRIDFQKNVKLKTGIPFNIDARLTGMI
jgi:hypothetical protein